MKSSGKFRSLFSFLLTSAVLITQVSGTAERSDLIDLCKASTLAPGSIFIPQAYDPTSAGNYHGLICKKEFLSIAFGLYKALFTDKMPSAGVAAQLIHYAETSHSFKAQLLRFDLVNMRTDEIPGVLFVPLSENLELRVYEASAFRDGFPLKNGDRLIENGSGEAYSVDVVMVPARHAGVGAKTPDAGIWRDAMARLCTARTGKAYKRISDHERKVLNQEVVYREVFNNGILPKLKASRAANIRQAKPSVLTVGITGSAASGKTTVAAGFMKELSKEFSKVRIILFDDWLLQAADRPIDPSTGKTTEDVFRKFEVDAFIRSIKAFIRGRDLLKPIYSQTAKGALKLTLDDKGAPVVLFGPKRNLTILEGPEGPVLAVRDEELRPLETAKNVILFDIPFSVSKSDNSDSIILRIRDTRIVIGPLSGNKERSVRIIDDKGAQVMDMTDPATGELIAEAGIIMRQGGYVGAGAKFIDKPWTIKEHIPYEDGVYIIEGILSLYDHPGQPKGQSLAELYTTSLFVDANFEVRLERGLAREKAREETLHGKPMSQSAADEYVSIFTHRKEKLEDPLIYATRELSEFIGTTETRSESIFSLYRKGLLLSDRVKPTLSRLEIDPYELNEELERIETDFMLDAIRRSTVNGELVYERKVEGAYYTVYFLKNGSVIKVARAERDPADTGILKSKGGEVMVPTSFIDISELGVRADGNRLRNIILQNQVMPLDAMLPKATREEAIRLLDIFFTLQKKMWRLGIVDKAMRLDRYGYMMTSLGKPAVLLFAADDTGYGRDQFAAANLLDIARKLRPDLKDYFEKSARDLIDFTMGNDFGSARTWSELPRIYSPYLSSLQLEHINSLVLEYKTTQLWRMFKKIYLPGGVSPEIAWTRLWIDTIAKSSSGAKDAIEALYKELLDDPQKIAGYKVHELREHLFSIAPPLSRYDKVQINKYLLYLCRIPLHMMHIGTKDAETGSTLRIKDEIYNQLNPADRRDLYKILSTTNPAKLEALINAPRSRVSISAYDDIPGEGREIYLRLRKPVKAGGITIGLLRIKGSRPAVLADGVSIKKYKGRGSVSNAMESYSSGSIIVKPGRVGPWGTMLYSNAMTEYELMDRFSGSNCRLDVPIGVGRYTRLKYENRPVGYVICGMECEDSRMAFITEDSKEVKAGSIAMMGLVNGICTDIDRELPAIYNNLGRMVRYFHDSGFVHKWLHRGNIGLISDKKTDLNVVLRDLDNAEDISTKSQAERSADRFLDISRVLYDTLAEYEYLYKYDETYEPETITFPELAVSFLKGYFSEMDPDGEEFKALKGVIGNGFVKRLERLVGESRSVDYEELSERSPGFGVLISELRKIEERTPPKVNAIDPLEKAKPGYRWPSWDETPKDRKVLVLVSGGDCAGLNPFIGYLASYLHTKGMALAGVKNGLEALTKPDFGSGIIPVSPDMASRMPYWSSVDFGSTRKSLVAGSPEMDAAIANIVATAGAIVVIGGNDHLNEAAKLAEVLRERGVTVVAVPKTIDNDTLNTIALGVHSSAAVAREEVYRASAVQGSGRCVIVEVMGRNMGSLALSAGNRYPDDLKELPVYMQRKIKASRATIMTLVPEHTISIEGILHQAGQRMAAYGGVTVVTAEGFKLSREDKDFSALVNSSPVLQSILKDVKEDAHHNMIIPQGAAGEFIAEILKKMNPVIEVLGFTPRGAMPTQKERQLAKDMAMVASDAISGQKTGFGVACSDVYGDPDRGVVKLVPVSRISGKSAQGRSLAKTLGQISPEPAQARAGVIIKEGQPLDKFSIIRTSPITDKKSPVAVAKAVLATAKSAWAHKRPSIIYVGGERSDELVDGMNDIMRGIKEEGVSHDYEIVRPASISLSGKKYISLSELVGLVYAANAKSKFVNIMLSGRFKISKRDTLLPVLIAGSEELAARLEAAGNRSEGSEYYVFDDNLKDLGQVVRLVLLCAKAPSAEVKKMSDVRLTSLDLGLNMLPGEEGVCDAELSMQAVHGINSIISDTGEYRRRVVYHVIDSSLIPESQEGIITKINKLTRCDDNREKVVIGNKKEHIEDTIARVLQKDPDAIIDAAVTDAEKQRKLESLNVLSLVFEPSEGRCNFRQIEGIIAALRAAQKNDRESLLKIYEILTGSSIGTAMPENMKDLMKKLVFTLPATYIEDAVELKRLNENLVKLIESA